MKTIRTLATLSLTLLLGGCLTLPRAVFSLARPTISSHAAYAELEHRVHAMVNEQRLEHRLPPLAFDPTVAELARRHSEAMARGEREFGHDDFAQRARIIRSVVVGSKTVGENIAVNLSGTSTTATRAVRQWIESEKHRENMLDGSFMVTGIGISRGPEGDFFYTQIFVARPGLRLAAR